MVAKRHNRKTQIAIEYAYRRQEADSRMWVFWVHASSATRFEESYRKIAQQVHIDSWADPKADVLSMVHVWLSDENNGRWTMVVDNADNEEVMLTVQDAEAQHKRPQRCRLLCEGARCQATSRPPPMDLL